MIPYFGHLAPRDVLYIWLYNIMVLFVVDAFKVAMFRNFDENLEVLPDFVMTDPHGPAHARGTEMSARPTLEGPAAGRHESSARGEETTRRLSEWAISKDERISIMRQSAVGKNPNRALSRTDTSRVSISGGTGAVTGGRLSAAGVTAGTTLRPYTPGNKTVGKGRL